MQRMPAPISVPEWTTREKLILASSVQRSGDQNWVSVSRTIRPLVEGEGRPPEFFNHKNCAIQYDHMLENVATPKRKRGHDAGGADTPGEQILRQLTHDRTEELKKAIISDHSGHRNLRNEVAKLRSGKMNDQLVTMYIQMKAERAQAQQRAEEAARRAEEELSKQLVSPAVRRVRPSATPRTPLTPSIIPGASPSTDSKLRLDSSPHLQVKPVVVTPHVAKWPGTSTVTPVTTVTFKPSPAPATVSHATNSPFKPPTALNTSTTTSSTAAVAAAAATTATTAAAMATNSGSACAPTSATPLATGAVVGHTASVPLTPRRMVSRRGTDVDEPMLIDGSGSARGSVVGSPVASPAGTPATGDVPFTPPHGMTRAAAAASVRVVSSPSVLPAGSRRKDLQFVALRDGAAETGSHPATPEPGRSARSSPVGAEYYAGEWSRAVSPVRGAASRVPQLVPLVTSTLLASGQLPAAAAAEGTSTGGTPVNVSLASLEDPYELMHITVAQARERGESVCLVTGGHTYAKMMLSEPPNLLSHPAVSSPASKAASPRPEPMDLSTLSPNRQPCAEAPSQKPPVQFTSSNAMSHPLSLQQQQQQQQQQQHKPTAIKTSTTTMVAATAPKFPSPSSPRPSALPVATTAATIMARKPSNSPTVVAVSSPITARSPVSIVTSPACAAAVRSSFAKSPVSTVPRSPSLLTGKTSPVVVTAGTGTPSRSPELPSRSLPSAGQLQSPKASAAKPLSSVSAARSLAQAFNPPATSIPVKLQATAAAATSARATTQIAPVPHKLKDGALMGTPKAAPSVASVPKSPRLQTVPVQPASVEALAKPAVVSSPEDQTTAKPAAHAGAASSAEASMAGAASNAEASMAGAASNAEASMAGAASNPEVPVAGAASNQKASVAGTASDQKTSMAGAASNQKASVADAVSNPDASETVAPVSVATTAVRPPSQGRALVGAVTNTIPTSTAAAAAATAAGGASSTTTAATAAAAGGGATTTAAGGASSTTTAAATAAAAAAAAAGGGATTTAAGGASSTTTAAAAAAAAAGGGATTTAAAAGASTTTAGGALALALVAGSVSMSTDVPKPVRVSDACPVSGKPDVTAPTVVTATKPALPQPPVIADVPSTLPMPASVATAPLVAPAKQPAAALSTAPPAAPAKLAAVTPSATPVNTPPLPAPGATPPVVFTPPAVAVQASSIAVATGPATTVTAAAVIPASASSAPVPAESMTTPVVGARLPTSPHLSPPPPAHNSKIELVVADHKESKDPEESKSVKLPVADVQHTPLATGLAATPAPEEEEQEQEQQQQQQEEEEEEAEEMAQAPAPAPEPAPAPAAIIADVVSPGLPARLPLESESSSGSAGLPDEQAPVEQQPPSVDTGTQAENAEQAAQDATLQAATPVQVMSPKVSVSPALSPIRESQESGEAPASKVDESPPVDPDSTSLEEASLALSPSATPVAVVDSADVSAAGAAVDPGMITTATTSTASSTGDVTSAAAASAASPLPVVKVAKDREEVASMMSSVSSPEPAAAAGSRDEAGTRRRGRRSTRTATVRSRSHSLRESRHSSDEEEEPAMSQQDDVESVAASEDDFILSVNSSAPATPSTGHGGDSESARRAWRKSIMLVWKEAASHRFANLFLHSVTENEAPGYAGVVHRPMDLQTVKKNIENHTIRTTADFQRDMLLMFQNALVYNRQDHDVFQMAREMRSDFLNIFQAFLSTQLMMEGPPESKGPRVLRDTRRTGLHAPATDIGSDDDVGGGRHSRRFSGDADAPPAKKKRLV